METMLILGGISAFIVIAGIFYLVPLGLWVSAFSSGAPVGLLTLVGMRLRRVNPHEIVTPLIKAVKGGLTVSVSELEAHYLSGGSVDRVVIALISAGRAGIHLNFKRAAAIDLAGRDVLNAVRMCVNPKVIETPLVAAMAMDGIQVKATARITVRANIDKLVGGAGEDTILARVGEGIVTTIGSASTHKVVLEKPELISEAILSRGLDSGTAFEILSVDIADVDVGKNIGSVLRADQAQADKKIAQAKAEEMRALAVAKEQEMKALEQEMQARVVEAEAEVPLAIAGAFREGLFRVQGIPMDKTLQDKN